jgi:hypothetical protein
MTRTLATLTSTALDAAERTERLHRAADHPEATGLDFTCDTCLALQATLLACRDACEAAAAESR